MWAKAKTQGQTALIKRCQQLIAAYPGRDRKKLKTWGVEVKALQKAGRDGNPCIAKPRYLSEKKDAVILRLTAATQMIDEMREFLPAEAHPACRGLKGQVEGLIPLVEMLCERHMPTGS